MNLQVSGHHLEITPAIHNYLATKLQRITHHFDHVIEVNVVLSVERFRQKIEANVHVRGKGIFVECHDADLYAAIDTLVDKLQRQLTRLKEKRLERRVNGKPLKRRLAR